MSLLHAFSTRLSSTRSFALSAFALLAPSVVLMAPSAGAQTVRLKSRFLVGGLNRPVLAITPPGDPGRVFIVEQSGVIKIFRNGAVLPTPFLDLDSIVGGGGGGQESGMLGMAFHPGYATNRRFYVSYTNNSGASVVREYKADPTNPDRAISSSFFIILPPVAHEPTHNAGHIEFGPNGKLYIALGDGTDNAAAQDLGTYLGKMLRVDVDNPPTYVAAGNPFIGSSRPHIWSYGWRNPWRFSFDKQTGDLYAADVGNAMSEEIDFQPAASVGGENYGWRCMEGNLCTGMTGCTCNAPVLRRPIHEYAHNLGCSIIGGYVYRGSQIPDFRGHYLFADFCSNKIWSFKYVSSQVTQFVERTSELDPPGADAIQQISSFGQDANGELFICSLQGKLYRVEADATVCPSPVKYCVRTPNSATAGAVIGWSGTGRLSANDLVLKAWSCPPNQVGFFLYGQGRAQAPYGNGILCVANGWYRTGNVITNAYGIVNLPFDALTAPGNIAPGSVWDFQFWFRDVAGGPPGFDLSDGLEVTFCAN